MSIFASETSTTIPIPFDVPQTVTIRKLTGREVEQAQAAHRDSFLGSSPRLWSATFRKALEKGATDPDVQKALADPLLGYDRYTVAKVGAIAWSYPRPVGPEAVDDLCDEALDFFATEILRLTKPALFLTDEEREAARKNV